MSEFCGALVSVAQQHSSSRDQFQVACELPCRRKQSGKVCIATRCVTSANNTIAKACRRLPLLFNFLLSSLSFRLAVQPCIEASPMVRLITTRLVFCMICSLPWLMLKGNQEGFWNCLLLSSFSFYCGMRGVQAKQKTTIYGVYHTKFFCVTLI